MQFQPHKQAFIWFQIVKRSIIALTSTVILGAVAVITQQPLFLFLALFGFLSLGINLTIGLFTRYIEFSKEKYELTRGKAISKGGSIFSDRLTELNLENVTNVELELPFLENWFFGTGNIYIESAGSSATEVSFLSIAEPRKAYEKLQIELHQAGFSLKKTKLIQQERPTLLGIVLDVISWLVSLFLIVFWGAILGADFFGALGEILTSAYMATLGIAVLLIIALISGVLIVIKFLDYRRRIYRIYDDAITYEEGLFTKHYSFIPLENLADSETAQTFLQKLLGIYTIVLSTRGTGNDIVFSSMPNGDQLEENIDGAIATLQGRSSSAARDGRESQTEPVKSSATASGIEMHKSNRSDFVGQTLSESIRGKYKPYWIKPVVLSLSFLVIGVIVALPFALIGGGEWLIIMAFSIGAIVLGNLIGTAITLVNNLVTTYEVKERSIKYSYNFLTRSEREFSVDKITALQVRKSIVDRLFGTYSLVFSSIGSANKLVFSNLREVPELTAELITAVAELPDGKSPEVLRTVKPQLSVANFVGGQLVFILMIALAWLTTGLIALLNRSPQVFILVSAIFLFILAVWTLWSFVYVKISALQLFRRHAAYSTGLIVRRHYFLRWRYIKDITSVGYPLLASGQLQLNVAGEAFITQASMHQYQQAQIAAQVANQRNAQGLSSLVGRNSVSIPYLNNLEELAAQCEGLILHGELAKEVKRGKIVMTAKPSFLQEFVPGLIFSLIFFPLLIFLPFRVLDILAISYVIEPLRIVGRSGWLYTKQVRILHRNIDHLEQHQGVMNKLFGTGTISVHTEGGSGVEMAVANVPNWRDFYSKLQEAYSGK